MKLINPCQLFVAISLLVCSFSASAGKVVVAVGVSDIEDGKQAVAYQVALANAKRAAIEQAVGTIIESRTIVENFQMASDQILSTASGRLKNYTVLEQGKTADNLYQVTIQAEADVDELITEVDRFQKALKWQKKPRITVIIDDISVQNDATSAEQVKNFLIDNLQDDKFPVFELSQDTQLRGGFVIHLNVARKVNETEYQGMKIKNTELSLNTRLTRADDAKVMATASAVKTLPGSNSSYTSLKASKVIVSQIWTELRKRLTQEWEQEQYAARELKLTIQSVNTIEQARTILKAFKSTLAGIKEIKLIRFDKQDSEYQIQYRGWAEQFVDELNSAAFSSRHFSSDIQSVAGNQILIKII